MTRFLWLTIAIWAAAAGLALILAAMPAAAQGQLQCAARTTVMASMGLYEKTMRVSGFDSNTAHVVQIYASTSGAWTLVITNAVGMTCLVASGTGFEAVPAPLPGQPG